MPNLGTTGPESLRRRDHSANSPYDLITGRIRSVCPPGLGAEHRRYYIFGMSQQAQQAVADVDAPPARNADQAAKPAETKNKPRQLPPYKVLLHNDDVNSFEHVIASILKVTTLTTQEAILRTLEAHESGLALLLTTHRERAELYVDQFASLKLTATIEPAAA